VAAHEVMHNLGGVQLTAPHTSLTPGLSGSGGHCIDEYDVMCYADHDQKNNLPPMTYVCGDEGLDLSRFDCGDDDYYNTNPAPGSYLDTHWNAADNRFLIAGPDSGGPPPDLDRETPVITWQAPVGNGLTHRASSGTVELKVTASDNDRVESVRFRRYDRVDQKWVELGTDLTAPYTVGVDVASLRDGYNQISAGAPDPAGNWGFASVFIERAPPTVSPPPPPTVGPPPPTADAAQPAPAKEKKKKKKGKKKKR
jgi:hypothetical protein